MSFLFGLFLGYIAVWVGLEVHWHFYFKKLDKYNNTNYLNSLELARIIGKV